MKKTYGKEENAPYASYELGAMKVSNDEWCPTSTTPSNLSVKVNEIYVHDNLKWLDDLSNWLSR